MVDDEYDGQTRYFADTPRRYILDVLNASALLLHNGVESVTNLETGGGFTVARI
jgi:hypothetical protein